MYDNVYICNDIRGNDSSRLSEFGARSENLDILIRMDMCLAFRFKTNTLGSSPPEMGGLCTCVCASVCACVSACVACTVRSYEVRQMSIPVMLFLVYVTCLFLQRSP